MSTSIEQSTTNSIKVDELEPETYLIQTLSNPNLPTSLKPYYDAFSKFYQNKLWFQLTSAIEAFLSNPLSAPFQIELYNSFIRDFSKHLNQLKLASISIKVARQFSDGNEGLAFLTALLPTLDTTDTQEAFVLATMESAHFKLLLSDIDGMKLSMDKCELILEGMDSVELEVHASYHRVSGDYFKAKAEYADYYKHSLQYLACINVEKDLTTEEQISRAHDLGISALLGTIYNFGELLMHPVLNSLINTPHEWIKQILFAFNAGDIPTFELLTPSMSSEPILQSNYAFLRQKICLMALIEAVFKRPSSDRVIPFAVIANETKVPVFEVEHLVMKALSLNLIHGTIDQVSSTTAITWVQPRVLDKEQIKSMCDRLSVWSDKVKGVADFAKVQAPEIFAV